MVYEKVTYIIITLAIYITFSYVIFGIFAKSDFYVKIRKNILCRNKYVNVEKETKKYLYSSSSHDEQKLNHEESCQKIH